MEWSPLDMRKTSVLRKEVDTAIQLLSDPSISQPKLMASIQKQIDELESFESANQDDERATLFEAQRNRLRKALSTAPAPSNESKLAASLPGGIKSIGSDKKNENPIKVSSTGLDMSNSAPTPNFFRLSQQSPKLYSDDKLSKSSVGSPSSPTRKDSMSIIMQKPELRDKYDLNTVSGRQKALYAWEIATDKNKVRKPLELDYGVFLPCSEFGLYTSEQAQGTKEDKIDDSTKYVDVQFILTHNELMALQSRVRRAHAETLAQSRTNKSSQLNAYKLKDPPSVRTAAPYVDPQRNAAETYRPLRKDLWIDKIGFRPTNPLKAMGGGNTK